MELQLHLDSAIERRSGRGHAGARRRAADAAVSVAEAAPARRLHRVGEARESHAHRRIQGPGRTRLSRSAAPRAGSQSGRDLGDARQSRPVDRLCRRARRCCPRPSTCLWGNSPDQNSAIAAVRRHGGRIRPRLRRGEARGVSRGGIARAAFRAVLPPDISSSASRPTRSSCCARSRSMPCTSGWGWGRASAV